MRLAFQAPAHHAGPPFGREVEHERLVGWLTARRLLPTDPYTRSHVAAGIELSLMEATAANAEPRRELARGATGRALRDAWMGRLVPLTLDALAHAAPFLSSDLAVRVLALVSESPATGFETRARIGPLVHGIATATPTIGGAAHDGPSVDERSIEACAQLVLPYLGSDPSRRWLGPLGGPERAAREER